MSPIGYMRTRLRGLAKRALSCRSINVAGLFLAAGVAISFSALAGDLDKVVLFNIRAENLDKALLQLGAQADIQLVFASKSTGGGKQTVELKGRYVVKRALANLLRGSNLVFVEQGNIVEIIRDPSRKGGDPPTHVQQQTPPKAKAGPQSVAGRDRKSGQTNLKPAQSAQLTEVTITGTRIPGVQPVGVQVQTISALQISQSGYSTTDQLMQSLPDVFRGGSEGSTPDATFQRGANAGYNFTGDSGVDLRGLGSGATLVLFNGHRIASSASGYFTDISNIPLDAIDHIDVLTDGASSIYGSDAIAGVVNIVPKQESSGLLTTARYGVANGFSTFDGNTNFGAIWRGGGISIDGDYSGQGALDVRDRPFTSSIESPTSILPLSHNVWLSAVGHQQVGAGIELFGDVEYSEARRQGVFSAYAPQVQNISAVPRWSGSVGAKYRIGSSWIISASYVGGQGTERAVSNTFSAASTQLLSGVKEIERFTEPTIQATGDVASLPGGEASLSLGSSYLAQGFSHVDYGEGYANQYGANRDVASGYAELRLPVVSSANAVPGIAKLVLAGSSRYDRYSDLGGTTNYKIGVSWYPDDELQARGAYSTSFRAPAVGEELVESERGTTGVLLYPLLNPQGTASVPVLFLEGAVPHLRPETATNLTLGLDYDPSLVPNARFSLNYYRIRYIDQLASVPFEVNGLSDPAIASAITKYPSSAPIEALVASAVENGAVFVDATSGAFGTNPLASTVYEYDIRTANLSRTDTSGVDFLAGYPVVVGDSRIAMQVEATYILNFFTQLTPQAPVLEEENTVGFPADFKGVGRVVWTRDRVSVALTGNYVASYKDTSSIPPGRVASYTTLDLFAGYRWDQVGSDHDETDVSFTVTDLFNRQPPFVTDGAVNFLGAHYDAANASPVGRMFSLQVSRHW